MEFYRATTLSRFGLAGYYDKQNRLLIVDQQGFIYRQVGKSWQFKQYFNNLELEHNQWRPIAPLE